MASTYLPTSTQDDFEAIDERRDRHPGLSRTVVRRYMQEGVGTQAAGIALFTLIALPATLLALVAVYGMVASSEDVATHVAWVSGYLPPQVAAVLHDLLDHVTASSRQALTLTAIGGFGFALLAAQRAMAATMGALDRIGHLRQRGTFLRRQLAALVLAITAIVVLAGATYLVISQPLIGAAPGAFAAAVVFLAILYRNAPSRSEMTWRGAIAGAPVAVALAVLASLGLSWWVVHASNYEALYGATGSMVVILLWAYLVAQAVLLGGLIAAETGKRQHAAEAAWDE